MYNVRSKQQSVKNKKSQDIHSFQTCFKLYCSCSANSKFKRNQSDNRFNAKSDPWIQTSKENDRLLRDEFKRYGLEAKKNPDPKCKSQNCPRYEKCVMNIKNSQHIGTLQKENSDQPKLKSKTESNLAYESYVEELKKELKAQREDIPSLPKKYKQKYLDSIKEELLLNKVVSEHEDHKKVKELIREIQVYRATKGSPYIDSMKSSATKPNKVQCSIECNPERCRKNKCKASSENGSVKAGKGRKNKKRSNGHKTQGRKEPAATSKAQESCAPADEPEKIITYIESEKPSYNDEVENLQTTSASDATEVGTDVAKEDSKNKIDPDIIKEDSKNKIEPDIIKEDSKNKIKPDIIKEESINKIKPDIIKEDSKNKIEPDIIKRLDIIDELIPKLCSVIEASERNLKKTFQEVFKSMRVVQERGVSPVEEIAKPSPVEDKTLEKQDVSTTQERQISKNKSTSIPQEKPQTLDKKQLPKTMHPAKSQQPFIGDLLVNIENIRESKCLLEGFQKELSQIKNDINECIECNFPPNPEENAIGLENKYCDKHGMYIPLIKMKYLCSRSDQIRIFSALKNEISLKKELENQLQKISKLEKELSKVKLSQNQEEIKTIESALQFTKSYFNNLLVKQGTERLLNEQQKILKQDGTHRCQDTKKCDKCSVETQIHEILGKVRESINKDIVETRQRLKIQKMPDISIKKPLEIQHTLRLNIPPAPPTQECIRNNVACETIFEGDKNEKSYTDREIQTRILINKTTSIESQSEKKSPNHSKNGKDQNRRASGQEGMQVLKFVDKSSYHVEHTEKKKKNNSSVSPTNEKYKKGYNLPYCYQFLKAREAIRESVLEIAHKTPSELGFRCTVGTQCDSNTSLYEPVTTQTIKTTENQAIAVGNSSNYLFGFKEYLRDKTTDCSSMPRSANKVDVVLQVNLDRSPGSSLDGTSKSVQSEVPKPAPPVMRKRTSIPKNKTVEMPSQDPVTASKLSDDSNVDSVIKKRNDSKFKNIPRVQSIKKMFFPPDDIEEEEEKHDHDDEEKAVDAANIPTNPEPEQIEQKLKTKRVSALQEEALDADIETGDVFYKSLIGTTEAPERKTIISLDNHFPRVASNSASNETLTTLSSEHQDGDEPSLANPIMLENMTEDEDVQAADEKFLEEESGPISLTEEKENRSNENQSLDYEFVVDKDRELERDLLDDNIDSDPEKYIDGFKKSIHTEYGQPEDAKISYVNYINSEDNIFPFQSENMDYTTESKENTEMLESIVSKIMEDAENKITEQDEMYMDQPEELRRDFNMSDFDYAANKAKKSTTSEESKHETVLSLFAPNYRLNINKKSDDHKGNILEKDFLPNLPIFLKSSKTFENYKSFHDSLQLSDDTSDIAEKPYRTSEHLDKRETTTIQYINSLMSDKYNSNESCKYAGLNDSPLSACHTKKTLDNSNPRNRLAGLKKITEERLEYAKKCSKEKKSFDSSVLSSEGEVKCKCLHVSTREYHHCPSDNRARLTNTPKIQYKNRLSSHIVLENERKRYTNWVTYYSDKKKKENSTSSSIDGKETKD